MRGILKIVAVLTPIVMIGGLFVHWARQARQASEETQCANNLKQIGLALHGFHDTYRCFPAGTCNAPHLPAEERISWMPEIVPYLESNGGLVLDRKLPWNAPSNNPVRMNRRERGNEIVGQFPIQELCLFVCPSNIQRTAAALPGTTHYVGIAGLGKDAADLVLDNENSGFFGYDRKLKLADMTRGSENTLALIEVCTGGPWTAGGPPTVRGLAPGLIPYVGANGQFGSRHPHSANGLFADGSVRDIPFDISAAMMESAVTLGRKSGEKNNSP